MRLYTYNAETKQLTAAPRAVRVDGVTYANPTQATLRRAGIEAYPLASEPAPTPPEGKVAVLVGYEVRLGSWYRVYRYDDAPPPPPKRYSVYRLIYALKHLNVTVDGQTVAAIGPVVEWVKAKGLYEELITVGTVDAGDEDLMAAVRELGASLGVTPEQIDALLASAEEN